MNKFGNISVCRQYQFSSSRRSQREEIWLCALWFAERGSRSPASDWLSGSRDQERQAGAQSDERWSWRIR